MGFFKGRVNRATYWLMLGVVAALIVIGAVLFHTQPKVSEIVLIFVCVPRLHDIGRSGWIAVGAFVAEIVVIMASAFMVADPEDVYVVGGVVALVLAGLLIWLGTIPGEPFVNDHGEPPAPGVGFRRKPEIS